MTGGALPPGLVTLNESVRHCVAREAGTPEPVLKWKDNVSHV
jgi:hypothetical protein